RGEWRREFRRGRRGRGQARADSRLRRWCRTRSARGRRRRRAGRLGLPSRAGRARKTGRERNRARGRNWVLRRRRRCQLVAEHGRSPRRKTLHAPSRNPPAHTRCNEHISIIQLIRELDCGMQRDDHSGQPWPAAQPGARSPAMSNVMSNIMVPIAVIAVAIVLVLGLVNMMRGGSPNRSQKLMRLRVLLQFIAIVVVMATIWIMGR